MREEELTALPDTPLRGSGKPSVGCRAAEVARAKQRRGSPPVWESMLHPPLAQKVAEAVGDAIKSLEQILGEDEDVMIATLAGTLGVTSDRVLVWAQIGIHDKAEHRAFFAAVDDLEQAARARNALRLLHGNGTFAGELAERIKDFRESEAMSVEDLAAYVSLLDSDVEALEAGRIPDILALVRVHSITGLVPELDKAEYDGAHTTGL